MSYLIINGGKKLSGTIENQSNKNSAIAIMAATLMIKGKTKLTDVPQIEEVECMIELLTSIGATVHRPNPGTLVIDASTELQLKKIDQSVCARMRASLLFVGALASRVKNFRVYKSGGCHLGQRTVRPHWYALQHFGINVVSRDAYYEVTTEPELRGREIVMYESGDAATENAILGAVLSSGQSVIKMASANYMVQDLCYFLVKAGAKIKGIGTTTLSIEGVKQLKSVSDYPIMPDPIVAMTYLSAAIATHSTLTVANCPLEFLELELCKLQVMGQAYSSTNRRKSKNGRFVIVDITVTPSHLTALPDKIYGRPFPGLNIDNLPLFVPILTQARGRTLVHDWAYENRAVYSLELQKLGAKITLLDPHRVWVEGPTRLEAAEVICSPALRPAVNILICMLAAKGRSILRHTAVIERGYENLYETLNAAGADITVKEE